MLVAGSLVFCVVLIELVGNLFGLFPRPSKLYRFSVTKGYDLAPGEDEINSAGLRDREYAVTKPPGTFRIVAIGDSFTFGQGVKPDETYSKRLEVMLNERSTARGLRYEVLNAGVPGYNTYQELIHLRESVLRFQPDLVVLGFNLSDADMGEFGMKDPRKGTWALHLKNWAKANLGLYGFLRPRFKRLVDRVETARFDTGSIGGSAVIPLRIAVRGEKSAGWDLCRKSLADLGTLARESGCRVLLVVFPILDHLDNSYPLKAEHALVGKEARESGMDVLDLLPVFSGMDAQSLWVKPTDGHPNPRGHLIAAEAIYGAMLADGLLPPEESPEARKP